MCTRRQKAIGVVKEYTTPMAGEHGFTLVEYRGAKRRVRFPRSAVTGVSYVYGTLRHKFLVDPRDIGRLLAWREGGERVFFEVDNASLDEAD